MRYDSSISDKLLVAASIVVIIIGLKLGASLIAPILFAFVLTVLVWPILKGLQKRGMPRGLSIAIVASFAVLCILVMIFVISNFLQQLSANIPRYLTMLNMQLEPFISRLSELNIDVSLSDIRISGASLAQAGISFASGFVSSVVSVVTFIVMFIFMILASDGVVRRFNELHKKRSGFPEQFASWSRNIQVQYKVQTINNLVVGVSMAVLFLVLGVDYAILWGILAFLLSYIPNIGLVLASIPPIILTFIFYGWVAAFFVTLFIILVNFIMDNIVTPKFIGAELKMPAAYIFLSFLVCSYLFGVLGAFLSVPLLLALRQVLLLNPRTKDIGMMLGDLPDRVSDRR